MALGTHPPQAEGLSIRVASERRFIALYDDQCEVCQSLASWLRVLDREGQVSCQPIDPDRLGSFHPGLELDACLENLHVVAPDRRVHVGWEAVALLARLFPPTFVIGALGSVAPFRWVAAAAYRFVAANRYALSKCRGGACRSFRPAAVRRRSPLPTFWTCYALGMVLRLPLILGAAMRGRLANLLAFSRTFRRRYDFLGGKLSLFFLGGIPCDLVPLTFGEHFVMVYYDGVAIDPGSPKMRRALVRHLQRFPGRISTIVATHHHEEHVGNLSWLARRLAVPLYLPDATAERLRPPARIPWIRRLIIGQPPPVDPPFRVLRSTLPTASGDLEVLPAPGHCDDHVVLYDRREKLLLAGDSFMGTYFTTPNPDVDSRKWIDTLEGLLTLDVEILVEGHGHIHTLRRDVPEVPGVVLREHPRDILERKLAFLRWLRSQIEDGLAEGLPLKAVEATCLPWGQRWSWEQFVDDAVASWVSAGDFSRAELVRSFVRDPDGREILPTSFEARLYA